MERELSLQGVEYRRQWPAPLFYKGEMLDTELKMDLYFPTKLVVELKAIESVHPIHEAQLLTYMRLTKCRVGLLINFNVPLLKDGIKRMVL
jgi:GxxExxY protein